nr:DUF2339 domain-containing protein [uncultured Desulfobulbus sp.]
MRLFFTFIAVLLAALAGAELSPHAFFGGAVSGLGAYLLLTVFNLQRRLRLLEQQLERLSLSQPDLPAEKTNAPLTQKTTPTPAAPPSAVHSSLPASPQKPTPSPKTTVVSPLLATALHFITRGNPVLKIGLVILFFGVGFLLKYAAQQNLLPLELRLAGVALGGMSLLLLGWRLQASHRLYGHGLEGGGIGILYLVVFAAARYYTFVPPGLALAMMIGLVLFSGILALLQDSRGMAVFAALGGFLAPILMASDHGNHVQLFSYYILLNCGILALAWHKAWRELNLVGLFFTFGLFTLWTATRYTPDLFASTEPFLLAFFLIYAIIAILFALRQPLKLRGFIDGPLVFGLPIVFSSLQAYLTQDFRYGLALSAVGLGGWYVVLARLLWNRMGAGMRMLTESFLALGVVFVSLAIPLGLDPQWTTASWALEGAAMIWVGVRQQRKFARIFGLLLQLGAVFTFWDQPPLEVTSIALANRLYLGAALIAFASLFSAYWFTKLRDQVRNWEQRLPLLMLTWGLIWWYTGGMIDLEHHAHQVAAKPLFLLYSTLTTAILAWWYRRLQWLLLTRGLLLHLPIMLLVFALQFSNQTPLLSGWSAGAWALALALQYRMLKEFEHHFERTPHLLSHYGSFWLVLLLIANECTQRAAMVPGLAETWTVTAGVSAPILALYLLQFKGSLLTWPVQRHLELYQGLASDIPLFVLHLWIIGSFILDGNPAPLPYLPLVNPLDLSTLAILLLACIRQWQGRSRWPARGQLIFPTLTCFAWLTVVTGRTVHSYTVTAYSLSALFDSSIFQAAIAALWSLQALTLTIFAARKEKRKVWLTGAALLVLVVGKLFIIDLSGTGSIGRIISFLVVGALMLIIGYFAPLPPKALQDQPHEV